MILQIYLDAYYISEPDAHSISSELFFVPKYNAPIKSTNPENGQVNVECCIMRNVMSSAIEA